MWILNCFCRSSRYQDETLPLNSEFFLFLNNHKNMVHHGLQKVYFYINYVITKMFFHLANGFGKTDVIVERLIYNLFKLQLKLRYRHIVDILHHDIFTLKILYLFLKVNVRESRSGIKHGQARETGNQHFVTNDYLQWTVSFFKPAQDSILK